MFHLKKNAGIELDTAWRNLLLSLIGQLLENEDKICGVGKFRSLERNRARVLTLFLLSVLCRRSGKDRIEVWTRESKASNEAFVLSLRWVV